ncbi:unnamed protein product [Knipowitschia caucasica]|uniref:Uncharacterized protein n=1 Tax=Knipowitschia caucasica TaxID=637954 RepID=A0AAV2LZ93_KNICA
MPNRTERRRFPGEEGASSSANEHDYNNGASGMECSIPAMADELEFPPLPVTPSKPPLAKKPSLSRFHDANDSLSNTTARMLADLINSRSDALEEMIGAIRTEMKVVNVKIAAIDTRVGKCEDATQKSWARAAEVESYGRRWNLRLHGVTETRDENVREKAIAVCQEVLPTIKDKMRDIIDVAHRVGKKRGDDPRPRSIIIKFVWRHHKEDLWKAAKTCAFLQGNGLRFSLDLSKEDKDNRGKLWPKIKKAREEGKTAYFVGGRGFADGVEIFP